MPAPATVTSNDVLQAGRIIVASGRRVTGGALRVLIGRGDTYRLLALWQECQTDAGTPLEVEPRAPVALPPEIEEKALALRVHFEEEFRNNIESIWSTAERLAVNRLDVEVSTARKAAAEARDELDEMNGILVTADTARDTAQAAAEQAAAESVEARGAAERAAGERTAALAARGRALEELDASRQALADSERRTATAEAARSATANKARQTEEDGRACMEAAVAIREQAAAEIATARAQAIAAREQAETSARAAEAAMQHAQAEAAGLRSVLAAASEERGRLLQRLEVAEAQLAQHVPGPTMIKKKTTPRGRKAYAPVAA